ncbi:MAG: VWA domain-containing protein, partial [Planctomycetales bacterium]
MKQQLEQQINQAEQSLRDAAPAVAIETKLKAIETKLLVLLYHNVVVKNNELAAAENLNDELRAKYDSLMKNADVLLAEINGDQQSENAEKLAQAALFNKAVKAREARITELDGTVATAISAKDDQPTIEEKLKAIEQLAADDGKLTLADKLKTIENRLTDRYKTKFEELEESARGKANPEAAATASKDFEKATRSEKATQPEKPQPAKKPTPPKKTWRRAEATPNASRLTVGNEEDLPLRGMQAHVRVDGFRARVLLDFQFLNDRDQQLEGTFKLRLPNEASPYFFAFGKTKYKSPDAPKDRPMFFRVERDRDMGTDPAEIMRRRNEAWTEPKESRMVPKHKASQAYHQTVRRRIDPALMEWSGAGVFSARVFPLEAGQMHRVVIGYDVDLTQVGDEWEHRLDLPSGDFERMIDYSVAAPQGVTASISPEAEETKVAGRVYYHFDRPEEQTLALRLKGLASPLLTGTDPETGDYFAVRVKPPLPEGEAVAGSSRAVFLVDTSLSSNPDRFNVWLKLLDQVLDKNRDSLKEFAVVFFNVESFWWKEEFTANTPENVERLMDDCRKLALEGATDLGQALAEAASPEWRNDKDDSKQTEASPDLFLLSDGAATWGEADVHALSKMLEESHSGALFAYATGLSGTDRRSLEHLARESGGAVFSVTGEAETEQAAVAHRKRPWKLLGVATQGGTDLLVAGRPRTLFPGQRVLLVGRGGP